MGGGRYLPPSWMCPDRGLWHGRSVMPGSFHKNTIGYCFVWEWDLFQFSNALSLTFSSSIIDATCCRLAKVHILNSVM